MFVEEGLKNEDLPEKLLVDIEEESRLKNEELKKPMKGLLEVNVVMAQNLKPVESDNASGKIL